jgi:hypothetical protein
MVDVGCGAGSEDSRQTGRQASRQAGKQVGRYSLNK